MKGIKLASVLFGLGIIVFFWLYETKQSTAKALTFYGNVDIREVDLAFRVTGRLKKMRFDEGDSIRANEVMADLDEDTFRESLDLATAQMAEATALEKNARRVLLRRTKLVRSGAVSQAQFDDAKASFEESEARLQTTKVRIEQAQTALQDTKIIAPHDGHILTRVREPGAIVNASQTVYTLSIDNPVWIRAFMNEKQLGLIAPGQKALIFTDARADKPYQGHIGYIASTAEFTPKTVETTELRTDLVYRFRVVVDNPDLGLRQGMPVTIKVLLREEG